MQLTQTRTPEIKTYKFKEKEKTFNESLFLTEIELINYIAAELKSNLFRYKQINSFNLHTRLITPNFLKLIGKDITTPEIAVEFYKQHAKQIYIFLETHKLEIAKRVINDDLIAAFKAFALSKFDNILKAYAARKKINYSELTIEQKNKQFYKFVKNDLLYSIRLLLKNEYTNFDYLISTMLYTDFFKKNVKRYASLRVLKTRSKKHYENRQIEPLVLFHNINNFSITYDAMDFINKNFK